MTTYIVLFRGMNVGGAHIVPMPALAATLEHLGLTQVQTYLQSGNAVFQSDDSRDTLSSRIAAALRARHGLELPLVLLTVDALARAIAENPFPEATAAPATLHLGFCTAVPTQPDLPALARLATARERYALIGSVCYLHAPDGIGRSRLAAQADTVLGVPMTSRNWRTVCALLALARQG